MSILDGLRRAFGGDDLKTLFVTAGGSLWSIRVNEPGKPVWPRLP